MLTVKINARPSRDTPARAQGVTRRRPYAEMTGSRPPPGRSSMTRRPQGRDGVQEQSLRPHRPEIRAFAQGCPGENFATEQVRKSAE